MISFFLRWCVVNKFLFSKLFEICDAHEGTFDSKHLPLFILYIKYKYTFVCLRLLVISL